MVRLQRSVLRKVIRPLPCLHPTMVRLQHQEATTGDLKAIRLHPTMVRLQLTSDFSKTLQEALSPSHYGSTATPYQQEGIFCPPGLHPTMVRLQLV